MTDAYNVRSNGQRYYVYRIDGNVQVAEFIGDGAAAKAQREAAIRNQRHNEQFGKKKESPEAATFDSGVGEVQTKPYPEPQKKAAPNPPPGQGVSF